MYLYDIHHELKRSLSWWGFLALFDEDILPHPQELSKIFTF